MQKVEKMDENRRRRLLRLEQVRQQSKDIACLVRQRVKNEREKELGVVKQRVEAKAQQWQVKTLRTLQDEYKQTIQSVGKGHEEALKLSDEGAERKAQTEHSFETAQKRGQEALARLREEEAARRRADEERRLQLQNVRDVEEARSTAVVALPRPDSTVCPKSLPPKKSVYIIVPPVTSTTGTTPSHQVISSKSAAPPWSKRSWPQASLPLGVSSQLETGDCTRDGDKVLSQLEPQIKDTQSGVSSKLEPTKEISLSLEPKTIRLPSCSSSLISSEQQDVKLYDHVGRYEHPYIKSFRVAEKVSTVGENASQAAENETKSGITKQNSESLAQKEQERSRQALRRVHVHRNYQQLMGSLAVLAKQKAALTNFLSGPSSPPDEIRQQQMALAVQGLLQQVDADVEDESAKSLDTPDGSLILSAIGETPGSVPKLNVGRWKPEQSLTQPVKDSSSPVPSGSPDLSSKPSTIVLATTPSAANPDVGSRQTQAERTSGLRTLLQRINEERQALLQPACQDPTTHFQNELQSLEEKVVQQRLELVEQRTEVERLDASIVVPVCRKQTHIEPRLNLNLDSSSASHESISIDETSDITRYDANNSSSQQSVDPRKTSKVERKKIKHGKKKRDKRKDESPSKYSMDVSLSSVVMDHSSSSGSGSQSVSLHGVQVLVKVSGMDNQRSGGSSLCGRDVAEKITEILSEAEPKFPRTTSTTSDSQVLKTLTNLGQSNKHLPMQEEHSQVKASSGDTSKEGEVEKIKTVKHRKDKVPSVNSRVEGSKKENMKRKNKASQAPHNITEDFKKNDVNSVNKTPQDLPTSASTSYMSPPDKVLSSLSKDIQTLISIAQHKAQPRGKARHKHHVTRNPDLTQYINRLLAMSRESIDRLNVSCSEVSTPSSALFHSSATEAELDGNRTDDAKAANVSTPVSDKQHPKVLSFSDSTLLNDQVDHSLPGHVVHQSMDDDQSEGSVKQSEESLLQQGDADQGILTDLTKECYDKIQTLNRMIEEVRRQAILNAPRSDHSGSSSRADRSSGSPLQLDSTAYMSPPLKVSELADVATPFDGNQTDVRNLSDPYSAAIMQLLSEVRNQIVSQEAKISEAKYETTTGNEPAPDSQNIMSQERTASLRPRPPVAFWRNADRCNMLSPTEPHELSTIPELGVTLPESVVSQTALSASPIAVLSPPSTPGTPPDVLAELMRRNLLTSPFSWMKNFEHQQKTNQQSPTSSNSSGSSSVRNQKESDLSAGCSEMDRSDISASRETNSVSHHSNFYNTNRSKGWKRNVLISPPADLYSSADEVEDFKRMGMGWVGAMLRKTKEAGALALSSSSSSEGGPILVSVKQPVVDELKDLSEIMEIEPVLSSSVLAALQNVRGHSTPVKHTDTSSSGGSRFLSGDSSISIR